MNQKQLEKSIAIGVAYGITRYVARLCVGLSIVLIALLAFEHFYPLEKDSTDPIDGRSGLNIKVDALTGCQYLTTTDGGLTPRLDKSCAQLCGDNK